MSKTPEELANEHANNSGELEDTYVWRADRNGFIAGYKTAEEKYKAQIKELETQLENWQHNAKHGDEGL